MTTTGDKTGSAETRVLEREGYQVFVSDAGAGRSMLGELALTRWAGDRTRDADGFFLYVHDLERGDRWSAGLQPMPARPERYSVRRSADAVEIARTDGDIEIVTDVRLTAEGDAELRRYSLTNRGARPRRLALTTYAEVALNTPAADAAHPAFSKLFVQTAYLSDTEALIAWRRPRSPDDAPLWLVHLFVPEHSGGEPDWESDRARFIGRGRSVANPRALDDGVRLSRTTGNVLDPIVSLRRIVVLAPGETTHVTAVLGAGSSQAIVEQIAWRLSADGATHAGPPFIPAPSASSNGETQRMPNVPGQRRFMPAVDRGDATGAVPAPAEEALQLDNGYGGFSADGREYVIRLPAGASGPRRPPLPWVNVVANERFGFLVSESGSSFTWSGNSRENRLTPWYNDPVTDPHGEALYVRDEDDGVFWSPTPGPAPANGSYEVRHGWGYSRFRHTSSDLRHDVRQFVPRHDPVKVVIVRITNDGGRTRRLSVFSYHELVLGQLQAVNGPDVVTSHDAATGDVRAVNRARGEFSGGVAFAAGAAAGQVGPTYVTCDRATFLGQYGSAERPAALAFADTLDGRVGAGLDPCAALQVNVLLAPGATTSVVFVLGEAESDAAATALVRQYADVEAAERALQDVRGFWRDLVSAVQVKTPSVAIDLLVNGWLAYQNLSCRMWGRSAFYQSGGAFGFRDQLQDASALVYLDPAITRRQIVLHAEHQFVEGDVLHWWHPPTGKGIRTRFSDDLLWLPYVAAFYVKVTGDLSVLDDSARFVTAPALAPDEDEAFLVPADSGERASIYEHCCRAIDRSLTRGAHGLPLIGTGDWNDGMNRVGREGRGESVWLGFFLHVVLDDFIPLADQRGDSARAARYREYRAALADALDRSGWDGAWYRRAFYDDGTPLGSARNDECRIDAIAQAWAVISGVAPDHRRKMALDALEYHLVSERDGIIRLLTPAFDRTPHDPGYIKGYLPGVRENGGQYTHGALWAVRAFADAGRAERAAPLLEMLSPVRATRTLERTAVYQVEPYVIAADVYGVAPHVGRGGWTWYTGSAGWYFRIAVESILGLEMIGGQALAIRPRIPADWPGFTLRVRLDDCRTAYEVQVRRPDVDGEVSSATLDGDVIDVDGGGVRIPLVRDGGTHCLVVTLIEPYTPNDAPCVRITSA